MALLLALLGVVLVLDVIPYRQRKPLRILRSLLYLLRSIGRP